MDFIEMLGARQAALRDAGGPAAAAVTEALLALAHAARLGGCSEAPHGWVWARYGAWVAEAVDHLASAFDLATGSDPDALPGCVDSPALREGVRRLARATAVACTAGDTDVSRRAARCLTAAASCLRPVTHCACEGGRSFPPAGNGAVSVSTGVPVW